MCPPVGHFGSCAPADPLLTFQWNGKNCDCWLVWNRIYPLFLIVFLQQSFGPKAFSGSNMAASQKVKGPVLAAVGCLELVPQAELPLVLQLKPDDGLAKGTSVLANHT